MGIIINQSIKGSIWSYLGVGVGFVTTAYLFPNYLNTDTIGLFSLLLAWSLLLAQFASMGFHGVTARLFPYFRKKESGHNGYLFILSTVVLTGFLLFCILFFFSRPYLIENNLEKSRMFADYINLLFPLTFFTLLFVQLDIFNKLLYNAVLGTFLQEFLQRVFILVVTLLFVFHFLNLHELVLAYAASVCAKGLILFTYLAIKGELNFRPQFKFITPKLRKEMFNVSLFSILTGLGGSIVFNVDKIIVNQLLGLSSTGVYTIAFFFGTLVIIPSRPLLRISGTLIADAFKRNDLDYIADIYRRSCLNQFIIGAFVFGGIWINIDNILVILGPEYTAAKWVIFFIGVGYLVDMITGANGHIIAYSKYYRVALLFIIILIIFVIITMYFFVSVWGIVGAATAIAASIFINNLLRYVFILKKYRLQPFSFKLLLIPVAWIAAYFLAELIGKMPLIVDIVVRSIIFSVVFGLIIIYSGLSDDINYIIALIKQYILKKMN